MTDNLTQVGIQLEEQTMILQKKMHEYKALLAEKSDIQKRVMMLSEKIREVPATEGAAISKEIDELTLKIESINVELEKMGLSEEQVGEATKGIGQHFHKDICLSNIRMLLKKTKTQLGAMEKEAGVSTGYMSRLEKDGNNNDPSIEFIVTAADTFGVSVDDLIRSIIPEMSPTEEYVLGFVNELKAATKSDEINWKEETIADLKKYDDAYLFNGLSHPLFRVYGDESPEGESYYSQFFGELKVQQYDSEFHAFLPGTNDAIYIEKVIFTENAKDEQPGFFYEIYLVSTDEDGDHVNPVCCTAKMGSLLSAAVESLYEEIEAGMKRVHISDGAKMSIAQFMNRKNPIIR